MADDTRIVYGARCTWWDSIDKVGKTPERNGISLPCCPHCGSPLFEVESIEQWNKGVASYAAEHPGYAEFSAWCRGRCFQNLAIAREAYMREEGKTYA